MTFSAWTSRRLCANSTTPTSEEAFTAVLSPCSACFFSSLQAPQPHAGSPILMSSRYEAELHELRECSGKSMLLRQRVANIIIMHPQ